MINYSEILNLDYRRAVLILKTLNRSKNLEEAWKSLGITERTLHRLRCRFNIKKIGNQYQRI